MQIRSAGIQAPVRPPASLDYEEAVALYDRRTRAAHEVMGLRYQRFLAAKDAFLAAPVGSREWYGAAERAYRLGLRSTHAYYLWTRGHTALVLDPRPAVRRARLQPLRLRLSVRLQSLGA